MVLRGSHTVAPRKPSVPPVTRHSAEGYSTQVKNSLLLVLLVFSEQGPLQMANESRDVKYLMCLHISLKIVTLTHRKSLDVFFFNTEHNQFHTRNRDFLIQLCAEEAVFKLQEIHRQKNFYITTAKHCFSVFGLVVHYVVL